MHNDDSRASWYENVSLLYKHFSCKFVRPAALSSCFLHCPGNELQTLSAVSTLLPNCQSTISLFSSQLDGEVSETQACMQYADGFGLTDAHTRLDLIQLRNTEVHKLRAKTYNDKSYLAAALSNGDVHIYTLCPDAVSSSIEKGGDNSISTCNINDNHTNTTTLPTSSPSKNYINTINSSKEECLKLKRRLSGHNANIWGLAWSRFDSHLISSSDDGSICVWDIDKVPDFAPDIDLWSGTVPPSIPTKKFTYGNESAVQAIETSTDCPYVFYSGDDSGNLLTWDTRVSENSNVGFPIFAKPYNLSFNAISNSVHRPWLLATGSDVKDVMLWDIRRCGFPVARFVGHTGAVNAVEFNQYNQGLLASASQCGNAIIWDMNCAGREQSITMSSDGPPELIFTHARHSAAMQDILWHYSERYSSYLTTVCDGGLWQTWAPHDILLEADDEYASVFEDSDAEDASSGNVNY